MFAFEEVAKDAILPWAIESAIGSSVVTSQSSIMANQKGKTVSLQPDGFTPDDPRRQQNIDSVLAQRERNMRIREEIKRADEESKNPHHELIDSILNNDDDLEPDDNPSENSVEIANREYINPDQPRRPDYPGNGGNGGGGFPSGQSIIQNIDKIDKIASNVVIPIIQKVLQKDEKIAKDIQNNADVEPSKKRDVKRQAKGEKLNVDIHNIFNQTLKPKLNVRKME